MQLKTYQNWAKRIVASWSYLLHSWPIQDVHRYIKQYHRKWLHYASHRGKRVTSPRAICSRRVRHPLWGKSNLQEQRGGQLVKRCWNALRVSPLRGETFRSYHLFVCRSLEQDGTGWLWINYTKKWYKYLKLQSELPPTPATNHLRLYVSQLQYNKAKTRAIRGS